MRVRKKKKKKNLIIFVKNISNFFQKKNYLTNKNNLNFFFFFTFSLGSDSSSLEIQVSWRKHFKRSVETHNKQNLENSEVPKEFHQNQVGNPTSEGNYFYI